MGTRKERKEATRVFCQNEAARLLSLLKEDEIKSEEDLVNLLDKLGKSSASQIKKDPTRADLYRRGLVLALEKIHQQFKNIKETSNEEN